MVSSEIKNYWTFPLALITALPEDSHVSHSPLPVQETELDDVPAIMFKPR
jgi:hypothetical protein